MRCDPNIPILLGLIFRLFFRKTKKGARRENQGQWMKVQIIKGFKFNSEKCIIIGSHHITYDMTYHLTYALKVNSVFLTPKRRSMNPQELDMNSI